MYGRIGQIWYWISTLWSSKLFASEVVVGYVMIRESRWISVKCLERYPYSLLHRTSISLHGILCIFCSESNNFLATPIYVPCFCLSAENVWCISTPKPYVNLKTLSSPLHSHPTVWYWIGSLSTYIFCKWFSLLCVRNIFSESYYRSWYIVSHSQPTMKSPLLELLLVSA